MLDRVSSRRSDAGQTAPGNQFFNKIYFLVLEQAGNSRRQPTQALSEWHCKDYTCRQKPERSVTIETAVVNESGFRYACRAGQSDSRRN